MNKIVICTFKGKNSITPKKTYKVREYLPPDPHIIYDIYSKYLLEDDNNELKEYPCIWFQDIRDVNLHILLNNDRD